MLKATFIDRKTKLNIDIYIKSLNIEGEEYIIQHREELIPDWIAPPQTMIFVFFECKCPLDGTNLLAEQLEKDRLICSFNQLGSSFYSACSNHRIVSDIICPKDGFPLYSKKGTNIFNIPSIASRYVPFVTKKNIGCGLIHQSWGRAVYPCLMMALAGEEEIKPIVLQISQDYFHN